MDANLIEQAVALLTGSNTACLSTLMPSGAPQVTPVWVDYDGRFVLVNTVAGRQKDLNTQRDPRVGLAVFDTSAPLNWVQVRGRVVEWRREGADEHLQKLSMRYVGAPFPVGDAQRVMLVVEAQYASWRFL